QEEPVETCLLSEALQFDLQLCQVNLDEVLFENINCGKLINCTLDEGISQEQINDNGKYYHDRQSHARMGDEQASKYVQVPHELPLQVTRPIQEIKGPVRPAGEAGKAAGAVRRGVMAELPE